MRARRFEVVDDEGRTRVVIGPVESPDPDEAVSGMVLFDERRRPRITVAVGRDAAWTVIELGGNALVHVGVNDPESDAIGARAFLYLCDMDGVPVAGWRIGEDGSVVRARRE